MNKWMDVVFKFINPADFRTNADPEFGHHGPANRPVLASVNVITTTVDRRRLSENPHDFAVSN